MPRTGQPPSETANPSSISTLDVAKSYVSIGLRELTDTVTMMFCFGPQACLGWLATHRTQFLRLKGYNTTANCGCAELNLTARLKGAFPWLVYSSATGEKLCDFVPPLSVNRDSNCASCRLLVHSLRDGACSGHEVPSLTRYRLGQGRSMTGVRADIWGYEPDVAAARCILPVADDAHLLGRLPDGYARKVLPKRADRTRMLEWLRSCEDGHASCIKQAAEVSYRGLGPKRLINTRRLAVVLAKPGARYLALSYVWGGAQQPFVTGLGNLKTESDACSLQNISLPKVIADAIQLTNELDESFLWVDALCINQDDLADKASEMERMNEVYLGALLTIVALGSEHADTGLFGVREYEYDRSNLCEFVEGIRMSPVRPSLPEAYSDASCRWSDRAWCFQEHLFSRRMLFIGKEQVYFSCLSASHAEDRHESDTVAYRLHDHPGKLLINPPKGSPLWTWVIWKRYVELYSRRKTTVEADRFVAFQGILREQSQAWDLAFVVALPLEFLPLALYWWHGPSWGQHTEKEPRAIEGRPTWSWTAWTEQVCFPDYERYQSQLRSITVDDGSSRISHDYDAKGVLVTSQKDLRMPNSSRSAGGDLDTIMTTTAKLELQARCLTLEAVDDGRRKGFLSLHDPQGARIGGVTQSYVDEADTRKPRSQCTLALVGVSWKPIGFFSNIESFIGCTVEEKSMSSWMQDMLAPVNARYKMRFDNVGPRQPNTRYKLHTPSGDSGNAAPLWSAKAAYYTLLLIMPILMSVLLLAFTALTIIGLALLCVALLFMVPMYGVYFAILRPIWIWSDFFRVAHVLWIEELEPGTYRRRGAGEVQYRSFQKLKPHARQIVLV
jgi:hypothetical protein